MTHLHVTVFSDAALIGLSVPHILCDGHGVTAISRTLSAILSGGPPPPPLNHTDPYAPFAINEGQVPSPPYWRVLSKLQTIVIYARALWEWLFDNRIENRDVYFPKSEVERLKAEAMDDIHKEHGEKTDLWISSSDAILAFCLKVSLWSDTSESSLLTISTVHASSYQLDGPSERLLHSQPPQAARPAVAVPAQLRGHGHHADAPRLCDLHPPARPARAAHPPHARRADHEAGRRAVAQVAAPERAQEEGVLRAVERTVGRRDELARHGAHERRLLGRVAR